MGAAVYTRIIPARPLHCYIGVVLGRAPKNAIGFNGLGLLGSPAVMHDETDARRGRTHTPSLDRPQGPRSRAPRQRLSRQLLLASLLPALASSACKPGELDERQEGYLRRQLDKEYSNGAEPSSEETSASPESSSRTPVAQTSEAGETSSAPTPTSEPDATSAAATSSASDTSAPAANQIPNCALQTFRTTCAGTACHYDGLVNLPPNFETTDDIFTMLTTSTTTCNGAPSPLYVDPANPEDSYLLVKIRAEQPSGCGSPMPPPDQPALTQTQIDCLEDWIGSL